MKYLVLLLLLITLRSGAQTATVSGRVVDEEERPLAGATVRLVGSSLQTAATDSGTFRLTLPSGRALALFFSATGYLSQQRTFILSPGEAEFVLLRLLPADRVMEEVIVREERTRTEAGLTRLDPKSALLLPSPVTGVEGLIKTLTGSSNELTAQYNVRGGSFDENLIYVNDFEVFRPYLVRSGQQEGLSFIHPELVQTLSFYSGGFPVQYGDKLSSVLDVQYRRPRGSGGSAYASLLEQGVHLEGATGRGRYAWLLGARHRDNRALLSSQATQGAYIPSSADIQGLLTARWNEKWSGEVLLNFSRTRFTLLPTFTALTSAVFTPQATRSIGLDIYFDGAERDRYTTGMTGASLTFTPRAGLRLKWLLSRFENDEREEIDITGAYLFGDREPDRGSPDFGAITNPLGAGITQTYARNRLRILESAVAHKGGLDRGQHRFSWGLTAGRTDIRDRLREWVYADSAGYPLPYTPDAFALRSSTRSAAALEVLRISAYAGDALSWTRGAARYTLQGGLRVNYNDLNGQWLLAPRLSASWAPGRGRDILFRAAAGAYHQPPFYRELRRFDGSLNPALRAQRSLQAVAGTDYRFRGFGRDLRLSAEVYFKQLYDVVPYDIDNLRLRYFGENSATAHAAGMEVRLFGALVPGAESWLSLGLMRTREVINGMSFRRPTDRRITFGMFFQDYLSTNENFKVYLNTLYGSALPYNLPGSLRYRNALTIDPYLRADIGFSALLLGSERARRRSHSPFRGLENIWATLEVFNLIDRANTVSYQLVQDFEGATYTLPNRLTPRLLNVKLLTRW